METMDLRVIAVNMSRRTCTLEDGTTLPLDTLYDRYGDDCDVAEAVSAVAGPLCVDTGHELWFAIDLAPFLTQTVH